MRDQLRRYKWLLLALIAVLLAALFFSLFRRAPEVEVAEAEVGELVLRLAASGLVEAQSADLGFQTAGRLVRLYVEEGQRIAASDLLARLSPLGAPPGVLGAGDVVQAPYDGSVAAIYRREGAVVNPGEPVLRVVSAQGRWVTAFVESEDAVHLRPGQRLRCRAGGYLSRSWDLTVEEVAREALPRDQQPGAARQVRVRCTVADPAFPLPAGAEVDVDGEVPLVSAALLIPTTAVVREGVRDWVWVLAEGRVSRRPVDLGPNDFDRIQIREGLRPGEQVVVHGKEGLEEGQRVRARPAPPPRAWTEGD